MIYLGVILGLGIMGGMVYLAIDKKSNTPTRIASLIALGIMVLTIIICLVVVLTDTRVPIDESVLIVGAPVETTADIGNNIWILLGLILFLIILFAFIVIQSLRENRKYMKSLSHDDIEVSKPISNW